MRAASFTASLCQALAVIILIEAIFLAEHFTWVFRDAVRHEADLSGIALVLACTSTEIFDLALAIAILMAAYVTLLRMRENREMLVLFASGLGPYQLGALVLIVALAGQVVGIDRIRAWWIPCRAMPSAPSCSARNCAR